MKFTCNAKDIEQALKNIYKVIPTVTSVNLEAEKEIKVIAAGSGSYIEIRVKGKIEKKGKVSLPFKDLEGATKGRGEMTFVEKGSVECSAGRYRAVLSPIPYDAHKKVEAEKGLKFTPEMQTLLLEMIGTVTVADIDKGTKPPVILNFGENGTVVACITRIHGVIATTKKLVLKPKTVYLQQDTFSAISAAANKKAFKITFDESTIIGFNDDMLVSIPTYGDVQFKWDDIKALLKQVASPTKQVEINGDAIATTLNNVLPFYENKSAISIVSGKNNLTLTASNGNAEIKEEIECKGTFVDCKINPKLVADVIGRRNGKLKMGFVSGNLVFETQTDTAKYYMLCACKS